MQIIYSNFDEYREGITAVSEAIFTISMTMLIYLSHIGSQDFVGTHPFKFFSSLFMAFGLLTYALKNQSRIQLAGDVFLKTLIVLVPTIIIMKLTNTVDSSGLYPIFYLTIIVFFHIVINWKSDWERGTIKNLSSREYLLQKYGRNISIMPNTLMFIGLIVPGVFNFPVEGFVWSLIVVFAIEHIVVFILGKNYAAVHHRQRR